ncbi:MAG: SDR family oxidoreductase [Jiangellaceae bacterium]
MFTVDSLGEGGAQLCPCGIATATPQHFTMASGTDIHMPAPKFPAETSDGCAPHPAISAKSESGAAYSISKAGVLALVRQTALESQGTGIRSNAIIPGGC